MILGIGTDIVHIPRIEKLIEEFGEKFLTRIFTKQEQDYATQKAKGDARIFASTLAKRWAAKEAAVKALGVGFGDGLHWNDVEVINTGKAPTIQIHVNAGIEPHLQYHLSMSDDYPNAIAFVTISR